MRRCAFGSSPPYGPPLLALPLSLSRSCGLPALPWWFWAWGPSCLGLFPGDYRIGSLALAGGLWGLFLAGLPRAALVYLILYRIADTATNVKHIRAHLLTFSEILEASSSRFG
jgi:hypothetical protein